MKFLIAILLASITNPLLAGEYYTSIVATITEIESQVVEPAKPVEPIAPVVQAEPEPTEVVWVKWSEARKMGKPTIVYFHDHPNCAYCVMAERVMENPEIYRRLNQFVCVKLGSEHAKAWGVTSFPHLILVDDKWNIVGRTVCPSTEAEMLDLLMTITGEKK